MPIAENLIQVYDCNIYKLVKNECINASKRIDQTMNGELRMEEHTNNVIYFYFFNELCWNPVAPIETRTVRQ